MEKPLCKYGKRCYRRNPEHLEKFKHPQCEQGTKLDHSDVDLEAPPSKVPKIISEESLSGSDVSIQPDEAPLLYLTKVRGISHHFNHSNVAVGMEDLLCDSVGDLVCSAQFNYLFDIPWLIQQYPEKKRLLIVRRRPRETPILIVYGDQRETTIQLRKEACPFPNVTLCPAKLEIMFGTHHSKMMLLLYKTGLRVVIHTANLIAKDWDQKTQGVWVSPLFPPIMTEIVSTIPKEQSSPGTSASAMLSTGFQSDLLEYLEGYGGSVLDEWKKNVKNHDMSSARVRLIASIPGAHKGCDMHKWGHLKLRKVLSEHTVDCGVDDHWPVVGQFSSIGSLGPTSNSWLCAEWLQSLSTVKRSSALITQRTADLQLIFPSVGNVRQSLEGYMAGGSLPYSSQNALKQTYLKSFFCEWKAEKSGRTNASPHIKTYTRLSPDSQKALWFLITSANLSKAAWGCLEKKGTQLKIRSYEIGVLFLPSDMSDPPRSVFRIVGDKESDCTTSVLFSAIPYDVPLQKYSPNDEPWVWNAQHLLPDRHGNIWTPPN